MNKVWFPQQKTTDAPIALLKTFIHHIRFPISRFTIESDVSGHNEFPNLSLNALKEIFQGWGLQSVAYSLELEKLGEIPTPSITFIHEQEDTISIGVFVLFFGMLNDEIEYLHPRKGWIIESKEVFEPKWSKALFSLVEATGNGEIDFEEKEKAYNQLKLSNPNLGIIQQYEDFISVEHCKYIIELSNDRFARSEVQADNELVISSRTSYSAYLTIDDDPILNELKNKCSEILAIPESHFEYFQCVSYESGQEYKNHYDTFDESSKIGKESIEEAGQRRYTILAYLNDDFIGGGTHFPKLDLLIMPKQGKIAVFQNTDESDILIDHSFHAGLPVTSGRKYALNIWVRSKPLTQQAK